MPFQVVECCEKCGCFSTWHRPSLEADGRWPLRYVECPLTRYEVQPASKEERIRHRRELEEYLETMRKGCHMSPERWDRFRDEQTELRDRQPQQA